MKKLFGLFTVVALVLTSLTGCAAPTYKVGMGTVIEVTGAAASAEADGKYGVNTYIATVALDKDGKIVNAVWDVAQTSNLKFDTTGALKTDLSTYALKTKLEKGADYGMKGNSAIGKEWDEQAQAFAAWTVGKTIEEVEALALDADGKPTDADVLASTTVTVSVFIEALKKAVENAVELEKVATVGMGTVIEVSGAAASAEADGKYGVNTYIATVALDKDGKIVNAVWDVAQTSNLKFDTTGALKTDLSTYALKTKLEKGADYGMKGNSAIGKEWDEQAQAFAAWTVGKTIEEVEALALDADGKPTDADVLASTTVTVSVFIEALKKAVENAVPVAE